MRVRALEKTYYAGRDRHPGEIYEMDDRQDTDIRILAVLGKIEIVSKAEPPKKKEAEAKQPEYSTRVMEPETQQPSTAVGPMTTEDNALTPPRRQRYQRRDMRARK